MSVYVITDGRYFKIGYTEGTVEARIDTLQTGNANRLILVHQLAGGRALEKDLHAMYAEKRLSGEWFNLSNKDLKDIKDLFCASCGERKRQPPDSASSSNVSAAAPRAATAPPPTALPAGADYAMLPREYVFAMIAYAKKMRSLIGQPLNQRYAGRDLTTKAGIAAALSSDPAHNGFKFESLSEAELRLHDTPHLPWVGALVAVIAIDKHISLMEKSYASLAQSASPANSAEACGDNLTF